MSSVECEKGPIYARRMPEEFSELDEFACDLIGSSGSEPTTSPGEIRILVDRVEELDDEALERNRYYGLGLIACGMAQEMQDPRVREHYMGWSCTWTVNDFIKSRFDFTRTPAVPKLQPQTGEADMELRIDDLQPGNLSGYLIAEAGNKYVEYPTLVLINCLSLVSGLRRRSAEDKASDENSTLEEADKAEEDITKEVLGGRYSIRSLGTNMTSATLAVIRAGLVTKRFHAQKCGEDINPLELSNPTVDAEEIRKLGIGSIAARFASLHFDQFRASGNPDGTNKLLGVSDDGELYFQANRITDNTADITSDDEEVSLHQQTLKCPAIHVPGMLRLIQGLIPEIVTQTKELIPFRKHLYNIDARYK